MAWTKVHEKYTANIRILKENPLCSIKVNDGRGIWRKREDDCGVSTEGNPTAVITRHGGGD